MKRVDSQAGKCTLSFETVKCQRWYVRDIMWERRVTSRGRYPSRGDVTGRIGVLGVWLVKAGRQLLLA